MLIRWKKDKGTSANSGSNKSSTKKKRKFGREGKGPVHTARFIVFHRFGSNLLSTYTKRYRANFILEFTLLRNLTPYSLIDSYIS
jgi:hypothetical protein